jgi:hypothetical protein
VAGYCIRVTVPHEGYRASDDDEVARLRSAASDVHSDSCEIATNQGDLSITLFFRRKPETVTGAIQFVRLAALENATLGAPIRM